MKQLITLTDDDLPLWLKRQLLDLYDLLFPRKPPRIPRTLKRFNTSKQGGRARFMLLENQKVISHAAILTKSLTHAGKRYKLAGLGGVLTHPQFQNKGFGTQVVKLSTDYIDTQDCDIAVLFCHRKREDFYGKNGWQILANSDITIGKNRFHAEPQDELTMIRYISAKANRDRKLFETEPIFFGDSW